MNIFDQPILYFLLSFVFLGLLLYEVSKLLLNLERNGKVKRKQEPPTAHEVSTTYLQSKA